MATLPGRFNDGHTAASRKVQVAVGLDGLRIRGEDGLLVAFWHAADLRAEQVARGSAELRLRCAADEGARLTVEHGEAILPLLPEPKRQHLPWLRICATLATTVLLIMAVWKGVPSGSRWISAMVPPEWEQKWGDSLANSMEKETRRCNQPAGEAALRLLTERLSAGMDPSLRPRRVVVIKQSDQNAFALPGGTVLVLSGLVDKAEGPGELAGVLAHEFTHLRLRHPTAAMIRATGVGFVVTLVTGDTSGLMATGATMALAGAYSREDETDADMGAVTLLTKAGLDAHGLAAFFIRIAGESSRIPAWLSTHPDSMARAKAVEAASLPSGPPAMTPDQWQAVKHICR
ncbi:MAG TPA: M48 family metallopeptidase [Magnetospirillum sp.]|nr:M48 family metallopeptidase [Magnetospirillum sp.]